MESKEEQLRVPLFLFFLTFKNAIGKTYPLRVPPLPTNSCTQQWHYRIKAQITPKLSPPGNDYHTTSAR
ncbi:hypothetical protein WJX72_010510 [[Myrmecia] bisecta]|uniref:Uncharacterized protein n=1 Tax=[Myrmecia] bisecta TaxID=41462 RepID=A0AAW1PCN1_9CHLO